MFGVQTPKKKSRSLLRLLVLLLALVASVVAWALLVRPGMEQVAEHRYVEPAGDASSPTLRAAWFGTTGVLLSDGEHAIMVDPFFTRPPGFLNLLTNQKIAPDEALIRRWLERAGVQKLDAVLVSHSHYDHAMDAGVVARLTGATLAGSASTAFIGRGSGLPIAQLRVVKVGAPMQFGRFTVTFIRSQHAGATGGTPVGDIDAPLAPPARYMDYKQGGTYSILVEHPLGNVLLHGSAGFVPGALAGRKADVVFLGIAIRRDMESYLRETVDTVGATRVIPTHWDDFTLPLDEPLQPMPVGVRLAGFFDEMARLRPEVKVETLEAGRSVVLFRGKRPG